MFTRLNLDIKFSLNEEVKMQVRPITPSIGAEISHCELTTVDGEEFKNLSTVVKVRCFTFS